MESWKNNCMYKLAIVPKIHRLKEYSSAYGSQHDYRHIKKCLKTVCYKRSIDWKITFETNFLKNYDRYDGVLFLGLSNKSLNFLSHNRSIDKFVWSFNQLVWSQNPSVYDDVSIVFEQSTRSVNNFSTGRSDIFFLPLGFQSDRFREKIVAPKYDIVFNGTLYRNRREKSSKYRRDLLEILLKNDISILNNNGRSKTKTERNLLSNLVKFDNFSLVNNFGNAEHYHQGFYALDLPFLDTEDEVNNENRYGMSWFELENTIWLNHWDIFRSIGAKANIITFDAPEIRALGLNDSSAHFYKSTPRDLLGMANEILQIVSKKRVKIVDQNTWNGNTYLSRWEFIINKICEKKHIPFLYEE